MSDDKHIVEQAYDHMADWYLGWIRDQISPRERYASKLLKAAPDGSPPHILELGCGPGIPVTRLLLDYGARVVANDISANQIALAKAQCPQPGVTFVHGDMATLSFEPNTFDGVTCFFTIFHLPRMEQKLMVSNVYSWLKPGSSFILNFATFDEEEIHGEMMGCGIFWSSWCRQGNTRMLEDVGFQVVEEETIESEADDGTKFSWIVARKG
jgi:ubiquinone/menaquinone biosynthesis C-methylase UbiE